MDEGEYSNSIKACKQCHGTGEWREYPETPLSDLVYYDYDAPVSCKSLHIEPITVICPNCNGAKKWREKDAPWTQIDDMPRSILEQMAMVRYWFTANFDTGRLMFISPFPLEKLDPCTIMANLSKFGKLGALLESHGWLVEY